MNRAPVALALGLTLLILTACQEQGSRPTIAAGVTSVTIDQATPTVRMGGTLALTATVEVVAGALDTVSWSSDDETIATIDSDTGTVTGVAEGTVTIRATSRFDGTKSASVSLIVIATSVTSVTIDQATPTVPMGSTLALTATVEGASGALDTVSWSSDDETIATIDSDTGNVTGVAEGTVTIRATSGFDGTKSASASLTVIPIPADGAFHIDVVPFDVSASDAHVTAVTAAVISAVDLWRTVIIGDLRDVPVNLGANESCLIGEPAISGVVDDLVIFVTTFDGQPGDVLASAGPCYVRSGGEDHGTPFVGYMMFDTADLDWLIDTGSLTSTVMHEFGHVLGIGALWEAPDLDLALVDYLASDDSADCENATGFTVLPTYNGANGVAAWRDGLAGAGQPSVEDEFGLGTRCSHWNDYTFGHELMTSYLNEGTDNPLSILTVRSLQDLGYTVNTNAAEAFTMPETPGIGAQGVGTINIANREILTAPIGMMDPDTGEVERLPGR